MLKIASRPRKVEWKSEELELKLEVGRAKVEVGREKRVTLLGHGRYYPYVV